MCGSMVDIQSPMAEIRRGKKRKKKPQGKNIMFTSATKGGHNYITNNSGCVVWCLCIMIMMLLIMLIIIVNVNDNNMHIHILL